MWVKVYRDAKQTMNGNRSLASKSHTCKNKSKEKNKENAIEYWSEGVINFFQNLNSNFNPRSLWILNIGLRKDIL